MEMMALTASIEVDATAEEVFSAIVDIRGRTQAMDAFQEVEIYDEHEGGFMATMREHYGDRDIVITSRFRLERPRRLTYEHIHGPYGRNFGELTVDDRGGRSTVTQTHHTEEDVSPGKALREQWLALMNQQLAAIRRTAEASSRGC